jgi:hypothetical protein
MASAWRKASCTGAAFQHSHTFDGDSTAQSAHCPRAIRTSSGQVEIKGVRSGWALIDAASQTIRVQLSDLRHNNMVAQINQYRMKDS